MRARLIQAKWKGIVSLPGTSYMSTRLTAAADLVETFAVKPNVPGRNVIGVGVFDSRRPAPAPVTGIAVTMTSPDGATTLTRPANRAPDGEWTVAVDDLRVPGVWRVAVTAVRPGLPVATAAYDWVVADPAAPVPAVSAARLAPVLDVVSLGLLLAALAAAGVLLHRRRRSAAPAAAPPGEDLPGGGRDGARFPGADPAAAGPAGRELLGNGPLDAGRPAGAAATSRW